jgi:septum formation protein
MLGKPQDEADAKVMLARLSGQTHEVYTAVCFADMNGELETLVDCTKVTFKTLSEEEIDYYVNKYRPLDKAGAYGVQEWIGYVGVTKMEGSYFNVMGFPISRVYETLRLLDNKLL